jgi:hypothetical protein
MTRIHSLVFDHKERPLRATIYTSQGAVKIVWRNVCGDRCWFTSGTMEAKKLTLSAIERIERFTAQL